MLKSTTTRRLMNSIHVASQSYLSIDTLPVECAARRWTTAVRWGKRLIVSSTVIRLKPAFNTRHVSMKHIQMQCQQVILSRNTKRHVFGDRRSNIGHNATLIGHRQLNATLPLIISWRWRCVGSDRQTANLRSMRQWLYTQYMWMRNCICICQVICGSVLTADLQCWHWYDFRSGQSAGALKMREWKMQEWKIQER